ncbi:hypothetical protein HS125_17765 [bacterium]|nr:hypothetical protein [bacterium]
MLEEFADALWGLEVGEISAPVKVGEDYHLIHLLAIQATEVEPFEVHAAELAEELTAARRGEARRQALAQAEATVGAVFHPQALAPDAPADALLYRVRERIKSGGDVGRWRENLSLEEIERYNDAESRQRYFREEYERELLVEYARLVGLDKRPGLVVRRRALRQLRLAEAFMAPLIEARAAAAPAPEGTLRNHHEEHRGSFITPLKVGLEQIHVSWSGLSGDSEEVRIAAAAERAGQITAKLAEGAAPRDFSETAGVVVSRRPLQEFDQLPAILRELLSPDLQYSPLPVLEAAPGALYGPVRAGEYFLIVRLAEVQPARAMDFEECRAAVEADYRRSLEPALLKYELDARLSAAGFRFLVPLPGPA